MRKTVLLGLLLLVAPSVANASGSIGWCYRAFGQDFRTCGIANLRQCLAVANAMGGRCEQSSAADPDDDEPQKPEKKAKPK